MLPTGPPDLEIKLGSSLFEFLLVGGELGELDVYGCTDGCAEVGWAEGQESEPGVSAEFSGLFNLGCSGYHAAVYAAEVSSHLHGDDSQVVLFVAPHEERLVVVVEDTTAGGPVPKGVGKCTLIPAHKQVTRLIPVSVLPASISSLKKAITFLEQKVIINELLLNVLGHTSKRIVSSLELPTKVVKDPLDLTLHLLVLSLSETRVEWVSLNGTTASYPGAHNKRTIGVNIHECRQVTKVTCWVVVGLLESLMVVINDGVEQVGEEGVCLGVGGVDSYSRVGVLAACKAI